MADLQQGVMTGGSFDISKLLQETINGKDPEQIAYGKTGELRNEQEPLLDESSPEQEVEVAVAEQDMQEAEPQQVDLLSAVSVTEDDSNKKDIDFVVATDESGRKSKIEIDYSNKDLIKKKFAEAAGMRKFQAERDKVKKEYGDIQKKYTELNEVYSKLDAAFQKGGAKGVIELLGGGKDAWAKAVDDELKHRQYLSNLTPQEKLALDFENERKTYQTQLQEERMQREAFQKQITEREEQAQLRSLESKLNPSFDRYRFSGKLGDEVVEHQLDEAVWNKVMSNLEQYPDEVELTQALIDKEFRTVANNFRKIVANQTEKTVQKVVENKKQVASERAQITAKKGLSASADKQKFVDDMNKGDVKSAFASLFSGKIKL